MPTTAQDRDRRGPFGALLILLSLFLAAGTAAATSYDSQGSAARLGSSRQGSAAALLPPGSRNPLDDEASGTGADPSLAESGPGIVTERLPARPRAGAPPRAWPALPRPAAAAYRARAPPAS